jgi:hypothetical protein
MNREQLFASFLLSAETVTVDLIKLEQRRPTLALLDLRRLFPDGGEVIENGLDRRELAPAIHGAIHPLFLSGAGLRYPGR